MSSKRDVSPTVLSSRTAILILNKFLRRGFLLWALALIPLATLGICADGLAQGDQGSATKPGFTLVIPSSVPLELVKVEGPSGEPVPHYRYTLRNIGVRPIVALATKWSIYIGDDAVPQLTRLSTADSWLGGPSEWLGPGQERAFILTGVVTRNGTSVRRFEGTPVYVEFDDGTRIGSESSTIFSQLTRERQGTLDEYRRALEVYNASGKQALIAELIQTKTSTQAGRARSLAAMTLLAKMQQKGLDAVVADLTRVATLRVPD